MASFDGYIGLRTDSKRLYMALCRETDTGIGKTNGLIWQLFFNTSMNKEETSAEMKRLMGFAREGEHIAAFGYSHDSVTDGGWYIRNLGLRENQVHRMMLESDPKDNETEFWIRLAGNHCSREEKKECPDPETWELFMAEQRDFKWDYSYQDEKREELEAERLRNKDALYEQWCAEVKEKMRRFRNLAEVPFGDTMLEGLNWGRWFWNDPEMILPVLRKLHSKYLRTPFIWDTVNYSPEWVILEDDDHDILDVDPSDFYTLDLRLRELKALSWDYIVQRRPVHLCLYSDAARVLKDMVSK